jgi:hypothetical protein
MFSNPLSCLQQAIRVDVFPIGNQGANHKYQMHVHQECLDENLDQSSSHYFLVRQLARRRSTACRHTKLRTEESVSYILDVLLGGQKPIKPVFEKPYIL